jgi:hypothetical protein
MTDKKKKPARSKRYRRPIRRTVAAMKNVSIERRLQALLFDWHDPETFNQLLNVLGEQAREEVLKKRKDGKKETWNPNSTPPKTESRTPKGSDLPQSQPSGREQHLNTSPRGSSSSSSSWRSMKSIDIVAFNAGAEDRFCQWLLAKLEEEDFGTVSVGWVKSNASYDLNVSPETIKRYIIKFTADAAPFVSEGGFIRRRHSDERNR